jgi:hypothetical protein
MSDWSVRGVRGRGRGSHRWVGRGPATLAVICALASAIGCAGTDGSVGAPVLLGVDIVDATGAPVMMEAPMPLSARVHFIYRFDRLLDPELIEEIVDGKPMGSSEVVSIQAAGEPGAQVTYIPNGHAKHKLIFASGPALVITPDPTLPSGAIVNVSLDKTRVQSRSGDSFVAAEGVSDVLTFSTEPFAASIVPMSGTAGEPLAGQTSLSVTFNNLPMDDIANRVLVEVFNAAGELLPEVEGTVTVDTVDPTRLVVAPASGSWPAGSKVTITIEGDAADALGMLMSVATVQSFQVSP